MASLSLDGQISRLRGSYTLPGRVGQVDARRVASSANASTLANVSLIIFISLLFVRFDAFSSL